MAMRIEKTRAAIAITVACLAAGIAAAVFLRRRRAQRRIAGDTGEQKPQEKFRKVLADNSYSPFKHLKRDDKDTGHPYEEEIAHLLENPPYLPKLLSDNSNLPPPMKNSYSWIDSEAKLESLAKLLSKEKIFAVDTEQHSFHSFLGFTALMQISTINEDYLIDTIVLHDFMSLLRPVFADPSICKVFHGADNDVLWFQRDFHIYVVNMFDTAKACEILSKPQKSLAYLLETYCRVITDKSLQLGDWRIRPLLNKMIKYARSDAHYLLYISNCLISELYNKTSENSGDYFFEASRRSNSVCLQIYSKEKFEFESFASAANSIYSKNLNFQELEPSRISELKDIIWKLCAWRDLMARIHDESLRYILSDQSIASLSTKLPKCPQEIYNTIIKLESPSNIILSHINELCNITQNPNLTLEDLFNTTLENRLENSNNCCPLSIYNYALLSQISSKKGDFVNFNLSNNNNGGERVINGGNKKASRENFIRKFSCKSPVYHNCRIYASDGRLLCYCDKKKLEWYVQRNLGKLIESSPPAIALLFEPKGRPDDEDNDFYIQSKRNICVGCGETNHYIRYRIIPSCYRMHFPEHLKSHRSHDIVLLCVDCHEKAHSAAERYKKKVAEEFGVPLFVQKIKDPSNKSTGTGTGTSEILTGTDTDNKSTGVSPLQLRTAAMALLRHGSTMPLKRHNDLINVVKQYYGGREITQKELQSALLIGMTPHEKRRLQKKNHQIATPLPSTGHLQSQAEPESIIPLTGRFQSGTEPESIILSTGCLQSGTEPESIIPLTGDVQSGAELESVIPSTGDLQSGAEPESIIPSSESRLSLLGHGPHGKLVVESLLGSYGEDGILQFCQKWRQVFVDGIQPRFLPSAWNINHSGRRNFGEYSVYNPANKVAHV